MGGIPTRSTTMKAALLLLAAVAGASANMESMMKEMLEGIDKTTSAPSAGVRPMWTPGWLPWRRPRRPASRPPTPWTGWQALAKEPLLCLLWDEQRRHDPPAAAEGRRHQPAD